MKLTLKKDIKPNSLMLKHDILLQASGLVMGREGVLKTEKLLYLTMAFVDNLIEEDLIALCNEDERDLTIVYTEDIEPVFEELLKNEAYKNLYKEVEELYLERCKEIWDNEHSFYGVLDAILTMIGSMDDEDKKEALVATGKIAEQAFDRRTQTMEKQTQEVNDKLGQLVSQYVEASKRIEQNNKDNEKEEVKEDAE